MPRTGALPIPGAIAPGVPEGRRIAVTLHALEQSEIRWPELAAERAVLRRIIAAEVADALAEGRYATRIPAWALKNGRSRRDRPKDRSLRFAWTESEDRLYLVSRHDGAVNVVTAIRPRDTLPS